MEVVTRSQLDNVPEVPFTDTWSPWHHSHIMETIDKRLKQNGLIKIDEHIELNANRMNMFGHVKVERPHRGTVGKAYSIGFRNSMQKDFALGFVAGEYIYVCSNMGFFGEYREVRIHNASLTEGVLFDFVGEAVKQVHFECEQNALRMGKLQQIAIDDDEMKVLTFDLMRAGIINPTKFNKFVMDFNIEVASQKDHFYDKTLAHIHGAVTRNLRGQSQHQVMQRTRKLDSYLKEIVA